MGSNLTLAGQFLLNTLFGLYIGAVLLRFLLQAVRADYYNPLAQIVVKLTNPLLLPLRRIIPGWRKLDLAALVLAYLLALLNLALVMVLYGVTPAIPPWLLGGVLRLLLILLNLYTFTILIQALMSWLSPGYHPVMQTLASVNEPLLRPVRRLIPPLGGLDLSPLFVLLGLQVLRILLAGH